MELSETTWKLLEACFIQEGQRRALAIRLQRESPDEPDAALQERIHFSIIRLIYENHQLNYTDTAFVLAQSDWRDLLMAADHGELENHTKWSGEILRAPCAVVVKDPEPKPATIGESGWVKCPNCSFRFKPADPNAWDGKKHLRCLHPLNIVPANPQ